MKRICLYYFSGTGLTKYIVDRFIGEFEKHHVFVECFKIEDANKHNVSLSGYDMFGIAYPVHSFNAPRIVVDFVKKLPITSGMYTFIIHTAGGVTGSNNSSSDLLIKKLSIKGYRVFYDKLIQMPSNFIVKHDDEEAEQIINQAKEDIPYLAQEMVALNSSLMRKNIGSKIFALIGRIEWYGALIAGKFFYIKSGCTRCGKCVKNCPNKNIVICKKSISFKWNCGLCMRCIYLCPKSVIHIYRPFKFFRFNKWYDDKMLRGNSHCDRTCENK